MRIFIKKTLAVSLVCIFVFCFGCASTGEETKADSLSICSFNIQFLGNGKQRDNHALADIIKNFDIVVVQELVAPPYPMNYPDGTPVKPDKEAKLFFEEMKANGFQYKLSEEDTGTGDKIHKNNSSTEWWVVFYKPKKVFPDSSLPSGFLASDRSNNESYERVPYAFGFKTKAGTDFVLISVHLKPGKGKKEEARRKEELTAIKSWIDKNDDKEKDFIILGDCNIENSVELMEITPQGYVSLNIECVPTNTNINGKKPYDHIFYNTSYTKEVDKNAGMTVVNLIERCKPYWKNDKPYPGNPYNHNEFRKYYSDHHPVVFNINPTVDDD